jgi:hypothetical protein
VETTFRFLLVGWSLADVDWPASAPSCSSSFVLRRYVGISFINKGKYSFMVDLLISFVTFSCSGACRVSSACSCRRKRQSCKLDVNLWN